MLFVICAHIILIAVLLSAKMTMPPRVLNRPTPIISIPLPKPPRPRPIASARAERPPSPLASARQPVVTAPITAPARFQADPGTSDPGAIVAGGSAVIPKLPPLPMPPLPVSSEPLLLTPLSNLKPHYPEAKLLTGEEATLTLRLSIDEHGRVVAVDPVGRADPVFLAAARRHLLAHWRYRPAMKDGRAIGSTSVVTLRFELDG